MYMFKSCTLESGINIALRLLIFWFYSRGYGLIPDSIEPILVLGINGAMLILFAKFSGAMVIQGATFIPNSRVLPSDRTFNILKLGVGTHNWMYVRKKCFNVSCTWYKSLYVLGYLIMVSQEAFRASQFWRPWNWLHVLEKQVEVTDP